MAYALMTLVVLTGITSLAVDWGRVQLTRSQLQQAADSAALYGASGLATSVGTVQTRAAQAVADNTADGAAITFNSATDVEFGVWDQATRNFVTLAAAQRTSATAIRVTTARSAARGGAFPLFFGKIIGKPNIEVATSAIVTRGKPSSVTVPANACPWLAGMPTGSKVNGSGENTVASTAPANSPPKVTGIDITPGASIVFRQASGKTSYTDADDYGPDGNTSWIVQQAAANGINTTKAPLNCMVAIFLDDRAPNTYSQATAGDFSTNASRNFSTLAPPLKQVFFIGDGLDTAGKLQQFTVPPGATRLYVGIMDEKGWWWDNTGSLSTTFMDDNLTLVQ